MSGVTFSGTNLDFGEYGLKSLGRGWITANQIEAARKAISHKTKRAGKLWIRIFPDKSITKKASGARMGGGKGDVTGFVAVVQPGRIIFEIAGVDKELARQALTLAAAKLPIKTKFIERD